MIGFCGGAAHLTVAGRLSVHTDLIEESDFYNHLFPIVNIISSFHPLQNIQRHLVFSGSCGEQSIAEGIAVSLGGLLVSLLTFGGVFDLVDCLYGNSREQYFIQSIRRQIRPIVSELVLTVMLSLMLQNVKHRQWHMARPAARLF